MHELLTLLMSGGGFAPARALRDAGIPRSIVEHALASGDVVRARRGWYVLPTAPPLELAAVRAGGLLTCLSSLHHLGLWTVDRPGLHLAFGDSSVHELHSGSVGHWRRWPGQGARSFSQDGLGAAILHLVTCVKEEDAIVTIDSALNKGLLTADDVSMEDWPRTEEALFTIIRRNEHLWTTAHRRRRSLG